MPGLNDDDDDDDDDDDGDDEVGVCVRSRTKFSLFVVLVTAVRCCMPSMHMTFTVPVACSSCGAVRSRVLGLYLYLINMSFPHLK